MYKSKLTFLETKKKYTSNKKSNCAINPIIALVIDLPKAKTTNKREIIVRNLMQHNSNQEIVFINSINNILQDERKTIVSKFKDYLLWDEKTDFLKRYFFLTIQILPV